MVTLDHITKRAKRASSYVSYFLLNTRTVSLSALSRARCTRPYCTPTPPTYGTYVLGCYDVREYELSTLLARP